ILFLCVWFVRGMFETIVGLEKTKGYAIDSELAWYRQHRLWIYLISKWAPDDAFENRREAIAFTRALALLPEDKSGLGAVYDYIDNDSGVSNSVKFNNVCKILKNTAGLREQWWTLVRDPDLDRSVRLRAAIRLALMDGENPAWEEISSDTVDLLFENAEL